MKHPLVLLALAAACAASAQPAPPLGRWITESGNLEVEIAPCAQALCGTVVRVLANRSMERPGEAMTAADPRPALGMTILSDLRAAREGEWKGEIYDRENAKQYSVLLSMAGPDQLAVRAYLGLPVFGKTQVWRRTGPGAGAQ
jgi:uncharacterized protein (DUF2147 family)